MGWRGFLYYHGKQRIAVIVLLFLIFVALLVNAVVAHRNRPEVVLAYDQSLLEEFEEFKQELRIRDSLARQERSNQRYSSGDSRVYNSSGNSGGQSDRDGQSENINRERRVYSSHKLNIGETIPLNSNDTTEWKKIPGIGSSYAARIVKYQGLLGGFVSKEQLKEVYGLDDELFDKISPFVMEVADYQLLKVNKLEFRELLRHPYLNYEQVKVIMNLRSKKGMVDSLNELQLLNEFTAEDIDRLKPYLDFR